jgi:hypothetical protein
MIRINREKGYIIISRCEYLYRDGLENFDEKSNREMGDGDIIIPLPLDMVETTYDHTGRTDGQNAVTIIGEIERRLSLPNASALLGKCDPVELDQDSECGGCGNEKRHRGQAAESLVCCSECWRRLPKWARSGFMEDHRRPQGGSDVAASIWQHRLSVMLQWMRDADNMPNSNSANSIPLNTEH